MLFEHRHEPPRLGFQERVRLQVAQRRRRHDPVPPLESPLVCVGQRDRLAVVVRVGNTPLLKSIRSLMSPTVNSMMGAIATSWCGFRGEGRRWCTRAPDTL